MPIIKYRSKQQSSQRLQHWLQGRYLQYDALNRALLFLELVIIAIQIWWPTIGWFSLLVVCVASLTWRLFSKNLALQINLNRQFTTMQQIVTQPFRHWHYQLTQHWHYRFFHCPNCEQRIRVPRHHGEIKITCPVCHHQFVEKT